MASGNLDEGNCGGYAPLRCTRVVVTRDGRQLCRACLTRIVRQENYIWDQYTNRPGSRHQTSGEFNGVIENGVRQLEDTRSLDEAV